MQRFRHREYQIDRKCAGQLTFYSCGIGQWTQYVKDRFTAQFLTHRHHVAYCRVMHWGHHKADTGVRDCPLYDLWFNHNVDAHLAQCICGAGQGR